MKKRLFAVYHGVRYEAEKISSRKYRLTARGGACPDGFLSVSPRSPAFYKNAFPEELDAVYLRESVAVYQGRHLRIVRDGEAVVTVAEAPSRLPSVEASEKSGDFFRLNRNDLTRIIEYATFY